MIFVLLRLLLDLSHSTEIYIIMSFYGNWLTRSSSRSLVFWNITIYVCYILSIKHHRCPPAYYGERCETKKTQPCERHSCKNNGLCRAVGNRSVCDCLDGYTGMLYNCSTARQCICFMIFFILSNIHSSVLGLVNTDFRFFQTSCLCTHYTVAHYMY